MRNSQRQSTFVLAAIVAALVFPAHPPLDAQSTSSIPLSPRLANYRIDVVLDAKEKRLNATEVLRWTNNARGSVRELQFHLYLNGFRNSQSTFMRESGGRSRGLSAAASGWGWVDVQSMQLPDGTDLLAHASFIAPDDGNADDRTVLSVPLTTPLRPGETIELHIVFDAQLPIIFARTGYAGDFFMIGQWFPKIGVYETAGMRDRAVAGWNCHQFHANTEFYADYGVYEVSMTVPRGYVVGATGLRVGEEAVGDTAMRYAYRAEDVHDFAWTCSPDYVVVEDTWEHVAIRLLMQPEHLADKKERYLTSIKQSLSYFDSWIGVYPYTTLTVVDPPIYASGAGGMEYPMLITGLSVKYFPEGFREVEGVTIHEFGHEYWYGLVGSNEFEEAWMDEGFNQYSETRIMDHFYGEQSSQVSILGFHQGDGEAARLSTMGMEYGKAAPVNTFGWKMPSGTYGDLTYSKTATVLATLERIIGRETFDEAMKTYFERWRFRHPSRNDFVAVVSEVVRKDHGDRFGPSMEWFFSQTLDGTNACDYELRSIASEPLKGPKGRDFGATQVASVVRYANRVEVFRRGEMMLPVDILVVYANGDSVRRTWDGKDRMWTMSDTGASRVTYAAVDPDWKVRLDENVLNNAKSDESVRSTIWKYTVKAFFWLQSIMLNSAIL